MTYSSRDGTKATLKSAQVSYFVFGYYQNRLQDPFTADMSSESAGQGENSAPLHSTILKNCFMELRKDGVEQMAWLNRHAHNTRLVCHAAKYNVQWTIEEIPKSVPAEELAKQFENLHPVAVGADTMDALEAYLEAHKDDTEPSLVHSVATMLASQNGDVHAQRQAAKDSLKNRFLPSSGGVEWHYSKDRTNAPQPVINQPVTMPSAEGQNNSAAVAATDAQASIQPERPGNLEIELINSLNAEQALLDAQKRHYDQLVFLLFCEWWKERGEMLNEAEIGDADEQYERLRLTRSNVKRITTQLKRLKSFSTSIQVVEKGSIDRLHSQLKIVADHPALKANLKRGIRTEFSLRKDPSILLIGVKSPWDDNFVSGNLAVRLTSQPPLKPFEGTELSNAVSQGLAQSMGRSFPDKWPLDPKTYAEVVRQAADGVTKSIDMPTSYPSDVRRLLLGWQAIPYLTGKAPKSLRTALRLLLDEWAYLDLHDYNELSESLPPHYFAPDDWKHQKTDNPEAYKQLQTRLDWNNTQAWFPLYIEWEADYFHIPWDKWSLKKESDGTVIYALADGVQISGIKGIVDDKRTLSGRSLVLPEVSKTLKAQLNQLFKQSTQSGDPKEAETLRMKILDQLSNMPFLSAKLEGLVDHLTTMVRGTHVSPHAMSTHDSRFRDGPLFSDDLISLMQGANTEVSPYGMYLDYQHHRRDGKDRAYSPFKPVTHGQVRFRKLNIVDKFGQVVSALDLRNRNELIPLMPYMSKSVACQKLGDDGLQFANTVVQDPEGFSQSFQLSPSINQAARLNACFVIEDEMNKRWGPAKRPGKWVQSILKSMKNDKTNSSWRPSMEWENPVWAWLMVNFRDGGVQIFDGNGHFIAEALLRERKVYWLPLDAANFVGIDVMENDEDDDNDSDDNSTPDNKDKRKVATSQLDFFLEKLNSNSYLQSFMDIIKDALERLHHAPNSYAGQVPAIFGRPLALVNMAWSLELATQPLQNQSTHLGADAAIKDSHLTSALDYEFQLKIGDKDNFSDGLVGYFAESRSVQVQSPQNFPGSQTKGPQFDFDMLYTEFSDGNESHRGPGKDNHLRCTSELPKLRPYFVDPTEASADDYHYVQNQVYQVFSVIVDPFSIISGYSAILPPKQLKLPPWTINNALQEVAPFLSMGPLLVPEDMPDPQFLRTAMIGETERESTGQIKTMSTAPLVKTETKDPPRLPVQKPTNEDWIWLQPIRSDDGSRGLKYYEIDLSQPDAKFQPINGPHTAIEGYLQLRKIKAPTLQSHTSSERTASLGDFFGANALSLDVSSKGSSGGLPEEEVDISFTLKRDPNMISKRIIHHVILTCEVVEPQAPSPVELPPPIKIPLNREHRISYIRPETDYYIDIHLTDEESGLTFPIRRLIPVGRTRADILQAEKCILDIPCKVTHQKPFKAAVTVKDRQGNLCVGYDDTNLLEYEGVIGRPIASFQRDHFEIVFEPFSDIGEKHVSVMLDGYTIGPSRTIVVIPGINIGRYRTRGSGLCTGQEGGQAAIEILVCGDDSTFFVSDYVDVNVEIRPENGKTLKSSISTVPNVSAEPYWRATFTRPPLGTYEVSILVEGRPVPGSPFTVQSVSKFDNNPQSLSAHFGKITAERISILIFDSTNSRWRLPIPGNPALRLRASDIARIKSPLELSLSSSFDDGVYECSSDLFPKRSEWACRMQSDTKLDYAVPGSIRIDDNKKIEWIPPYPTHFNAVGEGLHTGSVGASATVSLTCKDQGSRDFELTKENVILLLVQKQVAIPCEYDASTRTASYLRPSAEGDYFIRAGIKKPDGKYLEAAGSPFPVRALSQGDFKNGPKSLSIVPRKPQIGHSHAALLVVLDETDRKYYLPEPLKMNVTESTKDLLSQPRLDRSLDCSYTLLYTPKLDKSVNTQFSIGDKILNIDIPPVKGLSMVSEPLAGFITYRNQSGPQIIGSYRWAANVDSEHILGSISAPLSTDQSGVFPVIVSRPERGTNDLFQVETKESLKISVNTCKCRLIYRGIPFLDTGVTICDPTLLDPSSSASDLTPQERDYLDTNFEQYQRQFCFSSPTGSSSNTESSSAFFHWSEWLINRSSFPQTIQLHYDRIEGQKTLKYIRFGYDNSIAGLKGAGEPNGTLVDLLETNQLKENEYVTQVEILLSHEGFVREMSFRTSTQRTLQSSLGPEQQEQRQQQQQQMKAVTYKVPLGFVGLKGLWGLEGERIGRAGPIWGR
ncbi:hypothetical protein MMC18_008548 [Xylographa bjoerkii]|nr:hypothetical protein [Xylographa bjoerkii]